MTADHCEAKLHALRKTQDGVVVSFVLHPNDIPDRLMLSDLGTRYMLALAEIGDDEQPKGGDATEPTTRTPETPPRVETPSPRGASFHDMLPVKQAGILCADQMFWKYLEELHTNRWVAALTAFGNTEIAAARIVRDICCVQSRKDITVGTSAHNKWNFLLSSYQAWKRAPAVGA